MELKELAQRIRNGDRDALKILISEYGVGVYKKAYAKTQDAALAREATRQTFAQLVTALQEQTDMDGWELWLNALARRNIETYSAIGADMAYMERQLDSTLLSAPAPAPVLPPPPDKAAELAAARQFALMQQHEAQQYAAQQAAQRAAAQQADLRQPMQQPAQQRQTVEPRSEKRRAAAERRHGGDAAQKRQEEPRTAQSERLFSDARQNGSPAIICLLIPLCMLLIWLIIGVADSIGWIAAPDLGYEWFNEHVFELF